MIVDIIPMPIKIPPFTDVTTESRFWVTTNEFGSPIEEDVMFVGRPLDGSEQIYRYKMIESRPGMMIERSVVTLDELDTDYLCLAGHRGTSIPIFPITTKIHRYINGGMEVVAYRHANAIKELIHELYGTHRNDMYSVHQMYLHAMHNMAMAYNWFDVIEVLSKYADENHYRLKSLVCANEYMNTKLSSNVKHLVDIQMDLARGAASPQDLIAGIESVFKLPVLESFDSLSMHVTQKPRIESHTLRGYLSPAYQSRHYNMSIMTHDIFTVDGSVVYKVPEDLRWITVPLINKLELLPYTDLSIEYDGATQSSRVHYAISHFGHVPDFSTVLCDEALGMEMGMDHLQQSYGGKYTVLTDLTICLSKLIYQLPLGVHIRDLDYNLVKTFQDDVYLDIRSKSSGKRWKYYFDLTMQALGTRGIVSSSMLDHVSLATPVETHDLFKDIDLAMIGDGQLSYYYQ